VVEPGVVKAEVVEARVIDRNAVWTSVSVSGEVFKGLLWCRSKVYNCPEEELVGKTAPAFVYILQPLSSQ
jgi:hypothetical protein